MACSAGGDGGSSRRLPNTRAGYDFILRLCWSCIATAHVRRSFFQVAGLSPCQQCRAASALANSNAAPAPPTNVMGPLEIGAEIISRLLELGEIGLELLRGLKNCAAKQERAETVLLAHDAIASCRALSPVMVRRKSAADGGSVGSLTGSEAPLVAMNLE